ncbi:MAG: sigma-70 family RNA polymerase sigma factor [Bacteroidales bacterium]|nr:sigma-70 family RNA polymerase sigma factor [Bacteroidales bacterium]
MNDFNPHSNTAEFEQAISSHADVISRICFYYSQSRAEYEDLRQDAMLNLWKGWANFRGDSALGTWIYRVTLNTCVSNLRSRRRNLLSFSTELPDDLVADADSSAMQLREMHRLIGQLPPREKAVVLMWLDERPYDEIAAVMGASRNTVATWIRRAKEKLVKMSNQ